MKTINKYILCFTYCILLFVSNQPVNSQSRFSDTFKGNPFPKTFLTQAQHIVDKYRNKSGTPGVAVGLYYNGKTCFLFSGNNGKRDAGEIKPTTDFAMGSIEKVFNSTLLALAIAQGKVKINERAAKFLVDADGKKVNRNSAFRYITLKNLVTHTSALPRKVPKSRSRIGTELYHDRPLSPSVIKFLNSWHPKYPPGTKYKYSNLGFVLVGHAAVYLQNILYNKLLSDSLTRLIGMPETGMVFNLSGKEFSVAHNKNGQIEPQQPVGLWTCVKDMVRFIEANLGVLKLPATLQNAITITHQELFRVNNDHAVGMGWEEWHHGDALLLSKDGLDSGFSSWVGFEPHHKCGVIVLRNGGRKPGPVELGKKLLVLAESSH